MDTVIQMKTFKTNGNDGPTHLSEVTAGNGDGAAYRTIDATETERLHSVKVVEGNGGGAAYSTTDAIETNRLLPNQTDGCNGETATPCPGAESLLGNTSSSQESSSLCRIKEELNKDVFSRVKLWMVIAILLLIAAVIIISLFVCSAIHKDPDENFDPSLFKVPLYFNGSFQLPNMVFREELLTLSSNESQTLAADFQQKLAGLYRSSPAVGRYFSEAKIYAFRSGSVIADYQLTFFMPEEQQDQLRNFTLSREMVYNVLRQFLYDQEQDESETMYIDPVSLNMFLAHQ
ncbi:TPA-induced transmembrane protein [Symphorus nematophorus]